MGIVSQVGPEVKNLKVGDRVVAGFNIGCDGEECMMCAKGLSSACIKTNASATMQSMYGNRTCESFPALCPNSRRRELTIPAGLGGMLGYSHFTGGFAGGQAEYTRIPYGEANCIKIPEGVYDEDALYLSDSLVTSFHQVEDTGVEKGDVVGIWGVGVIGLLAGIWSAMRGASHIIAIDDTQWRLDNFVEKVKKEYPNVIVDTINFSEVKDVPAKVKELAKPGANGLPASRPAGLDVGFECAAGEYAKGWAHKLELATALETDTSEILNEIIESTINYGRIGITGVYAGYTNQ